VPSVQHAGGVRTEDQKKVGHDLHDLQDDNYGFHSFILLIL
jgi:hypothetical protein